MKLPYYGEWHMHFCEEIQRRAFPLGHARRMRGVQQVCCATCHTCLNDLREIEGGRHWCDTCGEEK